MRLNERRVPFSRAPAEDPNGRAHEGPARTDPGLFHHQPREFPAAAALLSAYNGERFLALAGTGEMHLHRLVPDEVGDVRSNWRPLDGSGVSTLWAQSGAARLEPLGDLFYADELHDELNPRTIREEA